MRIPSTRLVGLLIAAAMTCPVIADQHPPLHYKLDFPAGQRLAYEIEFEIVQAGRLRIEASWTPSRVLTFRIDRPGSSAFRRSGPPPLELELDVSADEVRRDAPWTLSIVGLSGREASQGDLFIQLPSGIEEVEIAPQPTIPTAPEVGAALGPWMMPATAPRALDVDRRKIFENTERFRQAILADGPADIYGWPDDLLRFLAERRDRSLSRDSVLQRPTRQLFGRIAEVVRDIERLSLAQSRPLGEPPPRGGLKRRAWESVRDPRFLPVEAELDAMLVELQRGHIPELDTLPSFSSFLSIVIACERHFEKRARLGARHAGKGIVVRDEWPRVRAAAAAMEALAVLP